MGLKWVSMGLRIAEELQIDVLGESEDAYLEISLTVALKGAVTWTGGVVRKEGSGSVFF
jgi:hypothetical protein